MAAAKLTGVLAPVVTPFDRDLSVDHGRLVSHCRWLLSQECGLALLGTNSEANSLSLEERISLLDAVVEAGLPPARMMPGTGCCSLPETVALTRHAIELGCAGVLMLPPFYYKKVSDDGLFGYFSEVIQRVGDSRLRIYLYHIPPVAQVPLSLPLLERLLSKHPRSVVGMKDSGGDWSYTQSVLNNLPNFGVFVGSEQFLLAGMRNGGIGCVSATVNVNPKAIHDLYVNWRAQDADDKQAALSATRAVIQSFSMIPALKAIIAHHVGDPDWVTVRPPLVALSAEQRHRLAEALDDRGFGMPGVNGSE
ncbi:MAG TPA: dihydrodipicolinate synthase family protein [Alphaproteobacteria bacterium]|nr:dihydrodipicolinate synthase family protein [Alphaproteobacteria bacterium]